MEFQQRYDEWIGIVNKALDGYMPETDCPQKNVYSAMRYSLLAGGKRLRPVLALAVCSMLGGDKDEVLPFACAIEMIHTYSLIHDDLPAMDNDDYRRGRLTNHKVYGEAMAILAGDGLLNNAFELMLSAALKDGKNTMAKVKAMDIIARAAGAFGMIGGQVVDLESEGKPISQALLEHMHKCKTGALIKAPVLAAAVLSGATAEELHNLETFAGNIGLAFQVQDDILDVEGSSELMGKKIGSDASNDKSTFVTMYGLEKSKEMMNELTKQAIDSLESFGDSAAFLKQLAGFLVKRRK